MKSLALKYRPINFEDVSGQTYIVKSLKNVIEANLIAHAYLFFGSRGTGKTSLARIVARCLNCEVGPTSSSCNKCTNCSEILNGNNPDVIEIDAASNRGIQYIRELRDNIKFSPMKSRYKVYIIDEVHMLTGESFNAFLKTLEEPPSHVIFILATTEKHKIPETILSRCQNFYFKKFTDVEIIDRLKNILAKENISFQDSILFPITQKAEGSMRDAISCLDQILAYSSSKDISLDEVQTILGILPFELHYKMLSYFREDNIRELLLILEKIHNEGYNLRDFLWNFLNIIKSAYLIKLNHFYEKGHSFSESQFKVLTQEAKLWDSEMLYQTFYNFYEVYSNLGIFQTSSSSEIKISIEMSIMSLSQKLKQPSVSSLTQKIIRLKNAIEKGDNFQDNVTDNSKQDNNLEVESKNKKNVDIDFIIQEEFMAQEEDSKEITKLFDGV